MVHLWTFRGGKEATEQHAGSRTRTNTRETRTKRAPLGGARRSASGRKILACARVFHVHIYYKFVYEHYTRPRDTLVNVWYTCIYRRENTRARQRTGKCITRKVLPARSEKRYAHIRGHMSSILRLCVHKCLFLWNVRLHTSVHVRAHALDYAAQQTEVLYPEYSTYIDGYVYVRRHMRSYGA